MMHTVIENHQTTCVVLNYIGQVQGVGMRPFLFRIADELNLKGRIFNHSRGVSAELEGDKSKLDLFHKRVIELAPKPIEITRWSVDWQSPRGFVQLEIVTSQDPPTPSRHSIQPDTATCKKCWTDFFNPESRFFNYCFVSCCECGPRWTILHRFPFERCNTSYHSFKLCHDCQTEYENPQSRRFHAQTLSCKKCGPKISISTKTAPLIHSELDQVHRSLVHGGVGLIKGLGGFQLIGNAKDPGAIEKIRLLKQRPSQALAIMVRDQESFLNMGGKLSDWEKMILPAAPIVSIQHFQHPLSALLAPDLQELGVMAPTTPFHLMLFGPGIDSIVVTSGNPKAFPIPKSKTEIEFSLDSEIDFIIDHDREVVHAIDDSVLRGDLILRKARGLTPAIYSCQSKQSRIAFGADLKNAIAIQIDNDIIEFPYCGDLSEGGMLQTQSRNTNEHLKLFDLALQEMDSSAVDLNPETITKDIAHRSHTQVPHHLAHACSAYMSCPSDLVLTFDGTGFDDHSDLGGGDGFVLKKKKWHLVMRLKPVKWVGGNSSVLEPWKSLVLHFAAARLKPDILYNCLPDLSTEMIDVFYTYACTEDGPMTTSMGRWFDAAAALIEFGTQKQNYEAQAPIRLEHLAKPFQSNLKGDRFLCELSNGSGSILEIDGAAILIEILKLKTLNQHSKEQIAYFAHDLMASSVAHACSRLQVKSVTGTGGVFQNKVFSDLLSRYLGALGIQFKLPQEFPVNDQCIAIGQLYYLENLYA